MSRRKSAPTSNQPGLLEARVATAPCVPAIREAVALWRGNGYKGISDTTRALLNYWFKTDHRRYDGRKFAYHYFQREAIETLIYLFEVAQVHTHKALLEKYAATAAPLRLLQYDDFARYCVKMATGSGKTKVIAMTIVWQYLNAVAEARDGYAQTFLLIAPNVIVYERLKSDFAGGRIFRVDPLIPPELSIFWDVQCYMRDEGERAGSRGALYLTNIHQLYDRAEGNGDTEPDEMTAVMGSRPPANTMATQDFAQRIVARGGPLLMLNDEAHHTHDEESEWNKGIRSLNERLTVKAANDVARPGLAAQLDFTATPRHSKGALFTWTVYDYPLKQAIIDNVVKCPIKGVTTGIKERPSQYASVKYRSYLTAGVERWREYREQLEPLKKKPVLFIMMNDTAEADDVHDWLQTTYPEDFGGDRVLKIHTDKTGEVSKRDLDSARKASREVDDETSPINGIVSVLMLREGWDVKNVTVIVGLRPYTSKANILPEQTIGRGLRLMFGDMLSAYRERVDVIGNKTFIEFVEQLEHEEDIDFDTFEVGVDKLEIVTVMPDLAKLDKDIALPVLSPILTRKKSLSEEIATLDVSKLNCPVLPHKQTDETAQKFHYEGYDFITLQKLVERDYTIPEPQTAEEVIGYYARRIAQELKLPSQFAALVPKVREFFETKAFGVQVAISSPAMIKAMSSNVANYVTVKTFVQALRELIIEEQEARLVGESRHLSETPAFPYSRPTLPATKTVFNLVACDNEFEKEFAGFLEDAPDVARFAKLPERFGFVIEYTDAATNLRYYEPDFVVVTDNGGFFLVETKGQVSEDVPHKNRAAELWCENATILTGVPWSFLIVRQSDYNRLRPDDFADLSVLFS